MRRTIALLILGALWTGIVADLHAQSNPAAEFLRIPASTTGNGWGGVSTAVVSNAPASMIANPSQLGLFAMENRVAVSILTPRTDWLPNWIGTNPVYTVTAIGAGMDITRLMNLPFRCGIGVGYSSVSLDLGSFERRDEANEYLGTFRSEESSRGFSIGVGIDYYLRVSLGFTTKSIKSHVEQVATGMETASATATASAMDWGMIIQLPVIDVAEARTDSPIRLLPNIAPLLDLTFGFSLAHIGDNIVYIDPSQADPLPRTGRLGMSMEIGGVWKARSRDWKILALTIAREAEDMLARFGRVGFGFASGFGDVSFIDNVAVGKQGGNVTLRKGWELNTAECVYLRGGSCTGTGGLIYDTWGYGIHLAGLIRIFDALYPEAFEAGPLAFVRDRMDVRYDYAMFRNHAIVEGTTFRGVTVILR